MEKLTENRTSAFRCTNLQIYLSWWNWTCFCGCLPQKGIRQPSTANYSVGWNARAPRRWQSITKTDTEDEAHKGKSSMLKTFLPSEGKTHDVSSSLGFAYQFPAQACRDSVCCPLWDGQHVLLPGAASLHSRGTFADFPTLPHLCLFCPHPKTTAQAHISWWSRAMTQL